ncbi:MAG: ABC transporter ATP-binding protein/permease [Clostridia bacterium]|nr:ABC transporter ATP-binding protein/permease [Clostridia bacterium]
MLELKNVVKEYYTEDETVQALKGVNLKFRKSEFVSILGPSGCGKTTMLNIVGGLDRYTDGDLIINGKSTKDYTDKDWDTYRNHSVGFVFQSYNLIPHQTVLENVELALTLSGIGKEERKQRAKAVLEKVGLGNKINSKPNQLSGGQMQRVAIARALINDPEILLADEPTGALDSKTSVQIMELLKEISKDRLIIMVTHNPDIAEAYSTRIIKMLDGEIVEDPMPVTDEEAEIELKKETNDKRTNKGKNKTSMSFWTALSLSLKNLLTKKARTILVSFAGSIGIIGIALILSLSTGFQGYINKVQQDTLSNYPLTIQSTTTNYTGILEEVLGAESGKTQFPTDNKIVPDDTFTRLLASFSENQGKNDLASFKKHLEETGYDTEKITAIQYTYDLKFKVNGLDKTKSTPELKEFVSSFDKFATAMTALGSNASGGSSSAMGGGMMDMSAFSSMLNFDTWSEAINSPELIKSQYDLVGAELGSRWPDFSKPDEVLVVLDTFNQIPDYVLAEIGFMDEDELIFPAIANFIKTMSKGNMTDEEATAYAEKALENIVDNVKGTRQNVTVEDLLKTEFYVTLPCEYYVSNGKGYIRDDSKVSTRKLKVVGVVRPKEGATGGALTSNMVYTKALTDSLVYFMENNDLVKAQLANPKLDMIKDKDGVPFEGSASYNKNLDSLGYVDKTMPSSISIYASTFENKDYIVAYIEEYNAGKEKGSQLVYDDYLGTMMSSITDIINAISYILIGFVSVSLIVSSIMIGIITYISVLERIKEIGILRALGASKRDVSRVFNAETLIIGLTAGLLGIIITVILNIPISLLIYTLSGIHNVASLPLIGGIALVIISMALTLIAGIIPASIASKQDPVVALRTE